MRVVVVLMAAGKGTRLGARVPKAWVELDGQPLFLRSLATFHRQPWVARMVLVMESAWVSRARMLMRRAGFRKVRVIAGGARRQHSVVRGVCAARPRGREVVLIHDCARPFVDPAAAWRVAAAARLDGAALAALPVVDTVKRAGDAGWVASTVPREGLWLAQTPQAIRSDLIPRWLEAVAGGRTTDDVQPLEALGVRVKLVPGTRRQAKITEPEDLELARHLAGGRDTRVGFGFDQHRLVPGRPLVLGGVRVPFAKRLEGHSDADLICHVLTDAFLGATGGGDIGTRFGVRRGATRNISSLKLLRTVVEEAAVRSWRTRHADVTLLAQAPRLGAYRARMISRLASALRVEPDRVSLKATTAKKMGEIGQGRAMAAFALVTVEK